MSIRASQIDYSTSDDDFSQQEHEVVDSNRNFVFLMVGIIVGAVVLIGGGVVVIIVYSCSSDKPANNGSDDEALNNNKETNNASDVKDFDDKKDKYVDPSKVLEQDGFSSRLSQLIEVKKYGVLGKDDAGAANGSDPTNQNIAITDPAGLPYIGPLGVGNGPSGASGGSGSIYKWLKINRDSKFPDEVQGKITKAGEAVAHTYVKGGSRNVVHVVGPNWQRKSDASKLEKIELQTLEDAYFNVINEYNKKFPTMILRLLPISGSIFAGPYVSNMPYLTTYALNMALQKFQKEQGLDDVGIETFAKNIEMCLFTAKEFSDFITKVGEHYKPTPQPS